MKKSPVRVSIPPQPPSLIARWGVFLAAAVIVLAVWAAYANSFAAPFVFDDMKSINENPTIRHLWPLSEVLSPPTNITGADGRPIVNLSLAVNYALGGLSPRGYHVFNAIVHALAALVLLGVVRRTLLRPPLRERYGNAALALAGVTALVWALHPLLTESVTCVVQRNESMMGLFYLFTLYAFIRSVESPTPRRWQIVAVFVCLVGMATKEVMVSAPVLVLLYDRTFVAGTFRTAWRERGKFYVGLAATWLLLAWLIIGSNHRSGTVGLGRGISSWEYLLTQCRAIVLYLRLSVWPSPLVVDYGAPVVRQLGDVWLQAVLLVALAAGTFVALWRRPVLGFVGFWFFAILAPSSSVVPLVTQTIAEHRMYLPLVALVVLAVVGGYHWLGRRSLPVWLALAVGAGWLTHVRNEDYRDFLTLWSVTAAQAPQNFRARMNYGTSLSSVGRLEESRDELAAAVKLAPLFPDAHYSLAGVLILLKQPAAAAEEAAEALRLKPHYAEAHYVLANALLQMGKTEEGLAHLLEALRLRPNFADAEHTLADALAMSGRTDEARVHYEAALRLWTAAVAEQPQDARAQSGLGCALAVVGRNKEAEEHLVEAVRLKPDYAEARYNLGNFLFRAFRPEEALGQLQAAVRLRPEYFEARFILAGVLLRLGRTAEAFQEFEATLKIRPDHVQARQTYADALAAEGRGAEALEQYELALRQQPDNAALHLGLGAALGAQGRVEDAAGHFETAVRLDPGSVPAHFNLGNALFALRRLPEAAEQYEAAVRLRPDFVEAHNNLGNTLVRLGRLDEAQVQYEETLRLKPDYAPARNNLARLQAQRAAGSPR